MTDLALELQKLGHEITVLTATPHYNVEPEARARQPLTRRWNGWLYESELHGIRIYHASIPVKGSRVKERLFDYVRFHAISTLAGLLKTRDYDLIFAPSPPLTIGLSAWILARAHGKPFVYNVQEIYPDIAVRLGVLKNHNMIRTMEWLERFIYVRARAITVISERFRRRLLDKGVPFEKLHVIPNFVDLTEIQPGSRQNDFSRQHKLDARFVVLYAGNIGLTQGMESIMAAADQLKHLPEICFLIVGDGTRRAWLQEQLAQGTHSNVMLMPYQSRSLVPQLYATSDVCLVPLKQNTAQDTFPSKIYTIMAAARPVIAAAEEDSELALVVHQAQCGWVIPPDDAGAMAQAVERVYSERATLRAIGQRGRTHVDEFNSPQAIARTYDQLLAQLVTVTHPHVVPV